MNENCKDHANFCEKLGGILEAITGMKKSLDDVNSAIKTHIAEAERPNGVRDRLGLAEASIRVLQGEISTIKQGYWKACIVSGVIGGLFARLAPELVWKFIEHTIKGF